MSSDQTPPEHPAPAQHAHGHNPHPDPDLYRTEPVSFVRRGDRLNPRRQKTWDRARGTYIVDVPRHHATTSGAAGLQAAWAHFSTGDTAASQRVLDAAAPRAADPATAASAASEGVVA